MKSKFTTKEFVEAIEENSINLFITAASFEERCFVIPNHIKGISLNHIIFYNENEAEEIIENAHKIKSILGEPSDMIPLNSDSPIQNYIKIESLLKKYEVLRPNILIDSTTFTHETLLVLLKSLSLRKESLGAIQVAYVGASQYSSNSESDEDRWLSKGVSEIRTIIGYPGFTDPTAKNHLVILVGFESERTRRIIQEYEYEYVTLGFGDVKESIKSNHHKINFERHKKLMEEYPKAEQFVFCLTDPTKTKEQISQYLSQEKFKNMNTVIAPLNNKISTIGVGLAALEDENIQLAYAKPNIYNIKGYSVPSEDVYFSKLIL